MPSCRSAPGEIGTWTARRGYVLPPTAWLDASFHPVHSISLHQSGEYVPDIRRTGQRHARWDYRSPCPDTDFAATLQWAQAVPPRWPQWLLPRAWCHGRWLRPLPHSVGRRSPRRGCFVCSQPWRDPWGCGQSGPPKRALPMAQSADCHSQFTPPNSSHPSTKRAQIRCSTPSSTQRWNVR